MKSKIVIVALLLVSVAGVVQLKRQGSGEPSSESEQDTPGVTNAIPRLLDLGAGKCVPCKAMAPILEEMRETFSGQLSVEFIDVWENEGAAKTHGIRIIPTQIFLDGEGRELFRHEGFYSREAMLAKWAELGYAFSEVE